VIGYFCLLFENGTYTSHSIPTTLFGAWEESNIRDSIYQTMETMLLMSVHIKMFWTSGTKKPHQFKWTILMCILYQIHTQCMTTQDKGTVMQETATGSSLYKEGSKSFQRYPDNCFLLKQGGWVECTRMECVLSLEQAEASWDMLVCHSQLWTSNWILHHENALHTSLTVQHFWWRTKF
jgi:hypothetical protein